MAKEINTLIAQIAKHNGWNPQEDSLEPKVEINTKEIYKAFREYYNGTPFAKELTNISGKSLTQTINKIPMGDLIQLAFGMLDEKDIKAIVKDGIQENGQYRYSEDNAEKYINRCRECAQKIWDRRETGAFDYDLSKVDFTLPSTGETLALNKLLKTTKLPPLETLIDLAKGAGDAIKDAEEKQSLAEEEAAKLADDITALQGELSKMATAALTQVGEVHIESDGTIPDGDMEWKKASEIFDIELPHDFEVPVFNWEGVHPMVPKVDEYYIFRRKELTRALYAICTNQRMYLHGHTGTGKTTLIEQVCARLNYPFVRINFDSEITRMDLIGRDVMTTIKNEDGTTSSVSTFVDGMLPRAMSMPCCVMLDELDFVRPDVAYVMQAATEGNGLRITEDGDRFVTPHPMFRLFASGNTVGQGDEEGLYQGARPQSTALLDRFTIWCRVDYLEKDKREQLIKRHVPMLSSQDLKDLSQYVDEHIEAFTQTKVLQPISPRGMLATAQATVILGSLKDALEQTIVDRASREDRSVLQGIIDRTVSS